ncbi:MAG: DUF2793 domain-containing protein [Proteobacteria bacterium]|nr:DUF2793 domain-containing protein [Pseudomonadota bacterium]
MALLSGRFGLPLLAAGQAQKELTHNEALALIDAALCPAAESAAIATPPISPAIGACWIVADAPTGAWSGQAGCLACWTTGGWRFLPAAEGMRVWLKDQSLWAVREATEWVMGEERASRILVDDQPVVGARGAAVALPAGGATIDAEARTAIAAIIDRLAAHGLIEA